LASKYLQEDRELLPNGFVKITYSYDWAAKEAAIDLEIEQMEMRLSSNE
jgi:hypothetical protein